MEPNKEAVKARLGELLDRGLSSGVGTLEGCMCIEACIATANGQHDGRHPDLSPGDDPFIVDDAIRDFSIGLNDADAWNDEKSRAAGLRDFAFAQLWTHDLTLEQSKEWLKRTNARCVREILAPTLERLGSVDAWKIEACKRVQTFEDFEELCLEAEDDAEECMVDGFRDGFEMGTALAAGIDHATVEASRGGENYDAEAVLVLAAKIATEELNAVLGVN